MSLHAYACIIHLLISPFILYISFHHPLTFSYISIHSSIHLCLQQFIHSSISLSALIIHPSPTHLFVYLLSTIFLFIHIFIHTSIYSSSHSFIIHSSSYLFIYLSIHPPLTLNSPSIQQPSIHLLIQPLIHHSSFFSLPDC